MTTRTVVATQSLMNGEVFSSSDKILKIGIVATTDGSGWWSEAVRTVRVYGLSVPYIDDEDDFGELRAFFTKATWNTKRHGLIYTDSQWIKEFNAELIKHGLDGTDVSYSEQGMQGDNYVSLDVGGKFLKSWKKLLETQAK